MRSGLNLKQRRMHRGFFGTLGINAVWTWSKRVCNKKTKYICSILWLIRLSLATVEEWNTRWPWGHPEGWWFHLLLAVLKKTAACTWWSKMELVTQRWTLSCNKTNTIFFVLNHVREKELYELFLIHGDKGVKQSILKVRGNGKKQVR